ncbi:MAG: TCP-1/cpn60 chaperonin family protein, partial [Bdellovibrio sp.]
MAYKELHFKTDAREKILKGVNALADAVRITLGPKSKCVLIQRPWGRPLVCNDGVTIAKAIDLKDPEENLGAQIIREAAERTGESVGDGTSTSTVLAQAIYTEGLHNIAAGASAIDLKSGLDRGLKIAVAEIKKLSHPIISSIERAQVATLSAHNDPAI